MSFYNILLNNAAGDSLTAGSIISEATEIFSDTKEIPETVSKMTQFLNNTLIPYLFQLGRVIIISIIVYFLGRKLIKFLVKLLNKSLQKAQLDAGILGFLTEITRWILNILLVIIIANILGFATGSLVALVGSAGLAVGLALQGSLANLAGGLLILLTKPFTIGDYIISGGLEGTVQKIDIFYTRLLTVDNKLIVVPNGTLSNSEITNVTNQPLRRLDLIISIEYSQDVKIVKNLITKIIQRNEMVLQDREISIFIDSFQSSSIDMGIRVWVNNENYWIAKWDLQEKIKEEFDKENIVIPFNQLDINITNNKEA